MSRGEEEFALALRALKIDGYEREFKFHHERRWRFDFAWPEPKIAVEVEGGHWSAGRHVRGTGFERDCEKYAEAEILGWSVLRVTTNMVTNGKAIDFLFRMMDRRMREL